TDIHFNKVDQILRQSLHFQFSETLEQLAARAYAGRNPGYFHGDVDFYGFIIKQLKEVHMQYLVTYRMKLNILHAGTKLFAVNIQVNQHRFASRDQGS